MGSHFSSPPPTKASIDALAVNAGSLDSFDGADYMLLKDVDGLPGMTSFGQNVNGWVRTTTAGIIPYRDGGSGELGTLSWPFLNVFSNNIYEAGTALYLKYANIGAVNTFTQQQNFVNGNSFVRAGNDGELILGASTELFRQIGGSYYPVITTENLGSKIAAITVGAVGDVALLVNTVAEAVTAGATYPGSQLRYSGMVGDSTTAYNNNLAGEGATPAGTWVALGNSTTASYTLTLYKRIA